jgi:mannose-6-phosphate isomerase-like protein (cupin superfamily)
MIQSLASSRRQKFTKPKGTGRTTTKRKSTIPDQNIIDNASASSTRKSRQSSAAQFNQQRTQRQSDDAAGFDTIDPVFDSELEQSFVQSSNKKTKSIASNNSRQSNKSNNNNRASSRPYIASPTRTSPASQSPQQQNRTSNSKRLSNARSTRTSSTGSAMYSPPFSDAMGIVGDDDEDEDDVDTQNDNQASAERELEFDDDAQQQLSDDQEQQQSPSRSTSSKKSRLSTVAAATAARKSVSPQKSQSPTKSKRASTSPQKRSSPAINSRASPSNASQRSASPASNQRNVSFQEDDFNDDFANENLSPIASPARSNHSNNTTSPSRSATLSSKAQASPAIKAAASKPKKPKQAIQRAPGDEPKRRRETLRLIDAAQRTGLTEELSDDDDEDEENKPRQRSKRHRMPPLEYWKNEHVEYGRSSSGAGACLPIIRTIQHVPDSPTPKKRKVTKRKPQAAAHKSKRQYEEESSELDDASAAPVVLSVVDAQNGSAQPKVVSKNEHQMQLEFLGVDSGSPTSRSAKETSKLLRGGKAFEEAEFSSGVLVLPPGAHKDTELAHQIESFYVVACERASVEVMIDESPFKVSKGGMFLVPAGCTYSIHNQSKQQECKLFFTLIRSQADYAALHQQQMAEQLAQHSNNNQSSPPKSKKGKKQSK